MKHFEKLSNQPLVIALAEFRFSAVLQMENYIPIFQDFLRHDFPFFSTTQQQEVNVGPQGINVNSSTGWVFTSSNKKRAVMLDHGRLVILTSEYNRYPDFWNDCQKALSFLVEKIKPTLLLRLGLRYSDAIVAKEHNEPIESYVQSVVCEYGHFGSKDDQIHRVNETILKTNEGFIAIRSLYGNVNLPVWQDLIESPVFIDKNISHHKTILLDFDHFWQAESEAQAFNLDFITNKMNAMHIISRDAFFELTTKQGQEVWK